MSELRQLWIAPPFDGPETGGTIYNRSLLAALQKRNVPCETCDLATFMARSAEPAAGITWLDSLYLAHAIEVRARLHASARLGLLMHYLPSLVHEGSAAQRDRRRELEREALETATLCIAPSMTLAKSLRELRPDARVVCIEPCVPDDLGLLGTTTRPDAALMVANLTENKGVLAFLEALVPLVRADDTFQVTIIGHHHLDLVYAASCRKCVEDEPQLRTRVLWAGGLAHRATLEAMTCSAVLISASRMESYGMAVAEARALGVPILAHSGGHVVAHVDAKAGGELVADAPDLARAFLGVMRNSSMLAVRTAAARGAMRRRSWQDAAQALCGQLESL